MAYKLGAVGFGHWFERLYAGMTKTEQIRLVKVAGVSKLERKADRLKLVGISKDNYYKMDPDAPLPKEFLDGLDIVHISDPNKYHARQTIQSLEEGKITITEKTLGVNKEEFYSVVRYIKENKLENKVYLHLHYLHKLLTVELENIIKRFEEEHGKIVGVSATFFESVREEDKRRSTWLFSMESGGLFMDWIHPFEILYRGAGASSVKLEGIDLYAINGDYDIENPTGIEARVAIEGRHFAEGAVGSIRIAKGALIDKKAVRFYLESGAHIELDYIDSDREATTGMRGCWTLAKDGVDIITECPRGPDTSEFLIEDILKLSRGEPAGFGIDYMEKIFETQWQYQDIYKEKEFISSKEGVAGFIESGTRLAR